MASHLFEANLAALKAKYSAYAEVMTALSMPASFVFEASESTVLCRERDGAWIHGPDNPWRGARRDAQLLAASAPGLYIVLRPGLGYQALALVRELSGQAPGSVVLMVEDRLELFRAGLEHLDWREALRFRGSVLLLGDPYLVVESFLRRHPALQILPVTVVAPAADAAAAPCVLLGERLSSAADAFQSATEAKFTMARQLIAERRARRDPLRVMIAATDVGYLAQPLRAGFAACGCDVVSWDFDPGAASRDVLGADALPALLDYLPDVVLWINQPELSRTARDAAQGLGITCLLWSVDAPRRVGLLPNDYACVDAHCCFDETYLERSVARHIQLSVGAGIPPLPGCGPGDQVWLSRQGPDVSFVGSFGESRIRELRDSLGREDPGRLELLERLAREAGAPGLAFEAATGASYRGSPCVFVDELRTMRRRTAVLEALPLKSLRIFGSSEWSSAGPLAECYAGRTLHYGLDLSALYFHSKINLNIFHEQCVDSTNSRVYDVLSAGGFLLTEDRPCLAREFQPGRHFATFSSPAEARDLVAYYLEHQDEREAMAREGQRYVLANHTFEHRCRKLLDLVAQATRA